MPPIVSKMIHMVAGVQ